MKRILLIIVTIFIALVFSGCNPNEKDSVALDDARFEEEEIKYEIEQILFSKSFQSIEPSVEIITNNNKLKILASLGLSEYSGINVNSIVKKGSEINIHVSGISNKNDLRLAVPQVVMELKKTKLKKIEDLKFNIIYDDYTPLKIKYGINDVLNKIQSHFKVSTKGTPIFDLIRINDAIVWDISYNSIFDKENPDIPLVNLSAQVDANTGNIIDSEKLSISTSLDSGHILGYINNDYILYKKTVLDKDTNKSIEQLWDYSALNNEKSMLYSSNFKISSAQFSSDLHYVSVIEVNDNGSELYIIPLDDKRAYKISFENKFNPKTMRWNSDNILYLIENNDDNSTVYSYNVKNNDINVIGIFNKNIENLIINNDNFLIVEKTDNELNRKISITSDWDKFKPIGNGANPKFLNKNMISYLRKNEDNDYNSLFVYDMKAKDIISQIEGNILNYEILPDSNIVYVDKNINKNDFTLKKYSLNNQVTNDIAHFISDKIYYDENRNLVYLNITLPFDNEKTEMIYSLDLSKLN
ncbi:hypothetical protein CIW83_02570 [Tissierella sp. P1]|jgi:hypothetical protein|uniref:hypothetical protein n=1 Tax=Tissierella TaxID=41273 RepID=UPI000B9FCD5A|nr:hypothetical protein [Tissierella sp. P1]MDU5080345.1 hypothetical protein [Bacillota bacterium]OZV13841.1 hypothetical protein CIW83_02570 [Tissierella sp. P1]